MSTAPASIERLFDRPPASRALRRRSRLRSAITLLLFLVLSTLIAAYAFVTDSHRVRVLSEHFLTDLTGGRVEIGNATLSLFEGLRLDDIRVFTRTRPGFTSPDDRLLFESKSLLIGYDPKALVLGHIEATRVVALEPHIHLVENVDERLWNFQKLTDAAPPTTPAPRSNGLGDVKLPEIIVRNAKVDYWQIRKGVRSQVGALALEGQVTPDADSNYRFRLQSRGGDAGVFPIAEGWLAASGDSLGLTVRDVEFVDEIKTILPADVRRFWEEHQLAGRIGETRVSYFRDADGNAGFKVETDLDGVRLVVPPQQWLGPLERARNEHWQRAFTLLGSPAMGGSPVARLLQPAMTPKPITLDEVDGTFVFTNTRIAVKDLVARAESNRFKISGQAEGYEAGAPFTLRISSLESQDIVLPESPNYITALPWPVQQIYYRFNPHGAANLWFDVERAAYGGRIGLRGELAIHDAGFSYERVPYPIDRVSGRLRIGPDGQSGRESLELIGLRGRGYAGGVNAETIVEVNGKIAPLDETAGCDITIKAIDLRDDPRLTAALPPVTRRALLNFDAQNTGKLPTFHADLLVRVVEPIGMHTATEVTTTIDVRNAAGVLKDFPYPLRDLAARLVVHDQDVVIDHLSIARGGVKATIGGRIDFPHVPGTTETQVLPNLRLDATGVPIDEDFLGALPPKIATKLRDAGLTGTLDLGGTIKPGSGNDEVTIDLDCKLRDASATVGGGRVALRDLSAVARLTQDAVTIPRFDAKADGAVVHGSAAFDWDGVRPGNTLAASVEALNVDDALIAKLPASARKAVRSLRLKGTIDADVNSSAAGSRVTVRPRQLSMNPVALPLQFEDLRGAIVIEPGAISLSDLVGRVGDADVRAAGTIDPQSGVADLSVAARKLAVNESFVAAMPDAIGRMLKSGGVSGTIAADIAKVHYVPAGSSPATQPSSTEFAGTLWFDNASMASALSATEVNGLAKLTGRTRGDDLAELVGELNVDRMKLAGRPVRQLTAALVKPDGRDVLQIGKIRGSIADGEIAGQVDTLVSAADPRYGLSLVLRNAKVAELTGETEKPIDGRLTASLQLEGRWDDNTTRRGRGDVLVEGREMYRVPVMFGMMQMATLAVPIDSFNRAGVRYSVQGEKVHLENIDLRSKDSTMQGTGWIDFGKKAVSMTLTTAKGAADSMPIFGDLLRTARQDMLQIRVRGSLEEPKVGASSFNTLRTTIDEVLNGKG